ncbi:hypothetical protein G7039_29200 (plasmid) [Rhizobium leguminosarum]|nr:hypothetical protein G7039_29200 [Rhizobium leguminosarum]
MPEESVMMTIAEAKRRKAIADMIIAEIDVAHALGGDHCPSFEDKEMPFEGLWDGGILMKGDTRVSDGDPFDFLCTNLAQCVINAISIFHSSYPDIDKGSGELVMVHPSGWGADGMYDNRKKYWVWEREDRERLARWLQNPEAVANSEELNEDNIRWRGGYRDINPSAP